jgi:predicted metalloprotease
MKYNDDAKLDTSQVTDTRGGGGGGGLSSLPGGRNTQLGAAGGGLGIVAIIVIVLINVVGGGGGKGLTDVLGQLGQGGAPATANNTQVAAECKTGADANAKADCAVVADIDSIQTYWAGALPALGKKYVPANTVWFTGRVSTACGGATSGSGPFYCPADDLVYIDLSFYDDLKTQFKTTGGPFVNAYVLAHEYGHHVQDLLGTEAKVKPGQTGPTSGTVRLELQADCYAGVWAKHATLPGPQGQPPLISDITQQDIADAVQAAGRIGDDWIQKNLGNGTVNQKAFTHGSSAQRQKWLLTGYQTGDPRRCDTFSTNNLG